MELADLGDAIPPEGRSPCTPLRSRSVKAVHSVPERKRGADVRETWTYPSTVLVPLVQQWSWRGRCKENRLLGAKAKALIPAGSLNVDGEAEMMALPELS